MGAKRKYKGVVIKSFKIAYIDERGTVTYDIGASFETPSKKALQQLINDKRIK